MYSPFERESLFDLFTRGVSHSVDPKRSSKPPEPAPEPEYKQLEPFRLYEGARKLTASLRAGLRKIPAVKQQAADMSLGFQGNSGFEFLLEERWWQVTVFIGRGPEDMRDEEISVTVYPGVEKPSKSGPSPSDSFTISSGVKIGSWEVKGIVDWTHNDGKGKIVTVTNREDLLGRAEELFAPITSFIPPDAS